MTPITPIILRDVDAGAQTVQKFRTMGIHPYALPLATVHLMHPILPTTAHPVIITSSKALHALAHVNATQILCVGPGTADRIRTITSAPLHVFPTAQDLAQALDPAQPYLYLRGHTISLDLKPFAPQLVEVIVYDVQWRTTLTPAEIHACTHIPSPIVLLYSQAMAKAWRAACIDHPDLATIPCIAISSAVADLIRPILKGPVHIAKNPSENAILGLCKEVSVC